MIKAAVILSFSIITLALFVPIYFTPTALAVNSDCTVTWIGSGPAAPPPPLPAHCQGGGAKAVLDLARKQIGKPYVFGGPSPRSWKAWDPANNAPPNFDCSSLVGWSWYWATGGKVDFPTTTKGTWLNVPPDKFKTFQPNQRAEIQPGDAIYWGTNGIHHTAIFSGPCQDPKNGPGDCIIEAQQTGVPVKESNFEKRISSTSDSWVGFIRPINY